MNYVKQLLLISLLFNSTQLTCSNFSNHKNIAQRWASYFPDFCKENKYRIGAPIASAICWAVIKLIKVKCFAPTDAYKRIEQDAKKDLYNAAKTYVAKLNIPDDQREAHLEKRASQYYKQHLYNKIETELNKYPFAYKQEINIHLAHFFIDYISPYIAGVGAVVFVYLTYKFWCYCHERDAELREGYYQG